MRMRWTIAAVVFQAFVLLYMAGEREWVLRTGQRVFLRTAPVDPRDPFRGEYVRLDYEISRIPDSLIRGSLKKTSPHGVSYSRTETRVYTALQANEDGLAEALYVTDAKPSAGLFIRGWTNPYWRGRILSVRYGIEAFFMQQKKAAEVERGRVLDGFQTPLEMEAAIDGNGLAVLRGYRWSRIAIRIEFDPQFLPKDRSQRAHKMIITLMNASSAPLAIVERPNGESFTLEKPDWNDSDENRWQWIGRKPPPAPLVNEMVRVLHPKERHTFHVDLKDPAWFVVGKNNPEPKSIAEIEAFEAFRFVYRAPSKEECRGLQDAALIWHGYLRSRTFRDRSFD